MNEPRIPANEATRHAELLRLGLLDTPAEERFDRITRIAKQLFATEIALLSLIDSERQWFKSRQGLDACETPRAISFCGHAILQDDVFVVEDARQHPDFFDNPLVTGAPFIRFYAGVPVYGIQRLPIGTLCIIDPAPRPFSHQDRINLLDLARILESEINAEDLARQEQTLIQAKNLAEAANVAKSQFLANMSHEIRTPMNAVLGMAHLLANTELNHEQQHLLAMVKHSGESLMVILNDILDFSKIEAGRMELSPTEFQLDDVLNTLGAIMGMNTGNKDLDLAIVIAPEVPQCLYGDAMRLQQILINLCANAIKFTHQGEVTLLIRRAATASDQQTTQQTAQQPDQAQHLPTHPQPVQLEFLIRDTGIGIDAEQQTRLFSAFNQAENSTTRRFGGTGLGLTISRKLAHLMGGEISLRSGAGQGSEFCLKLALQQVPSKPLVPPIGRLHLLLIDDNLPCRNAFANIMQSWNSRLDCCASLQEAIALQSHGARHYDAIVADWQLLGGSPLPPALALAPLILTCNLRGKQELIERQGHGDPVLLKPVTSSGLYDTLYHVLPKQDQNRPTTTSKKLAERRIVGARLLLVEDNPLNQLVAQNMLVRAGASVEVVNNGYEAVEILRWKAAQYDLVLMDVQMPVMDGFAATNMLRQDLHLTLPVLAMTAGVLPSEQEKCRSAGMDAIISKPIHFEEMISTILRHLPAHAIRPPPDEIINGDALMEICEAQPEFLPTLIELIRRMMAQSQPQLQQVRQHVSLGQNDAAAIILHGMRGSIGFLDAKAFSATALALENAIRENNQVAIPALLDATDASLQQVLLAVQPWLAKLE